VEKTSATANVVSGLKVILHVLKDRLKEKTELKSRGKSGIWGGGLKGRDIGGPSLKSRGRACMSEAD